MITLYTLPPSGNAQKIRLALRLLNQPFEEISLSGGAHKQAWYLALNPLGQVPVLVDGDAVLRDSQAILVYLAAAYAPGEWDGHTPAERGRIAQWLSLASNEISGGLATLRRAVLLGTAIDRPAAEVLAERVLTLLEHRLADRTWLEGDRLTIADLACSAYVALSHQGGVDLARYPALQRWIQRITVLPNFPAMPGWPAQS